MRVKVNGGGAVDNGATMDSTTSKSPEVSGILGEGGCGIKSEELDLLSEQAITELKLFPNIFVRVAANVGVAIGIIGMDIAKHAADVMLANDNFNTIIEIVQEGRQVFDNILKLIIF
ncbi:hypothetical protein BGZ51_001625 [Haplosporangium sp. Z 767]|nr:hypothetical protein BGZ51_001625 [Haplosporangium sp. Z 767]KAF9188279.1 hypothetical protein BGZ50_001457 [Haplosporangium sp. Z 11]